MFRSKVLISRSLSLFFSDSGRFSSLICWRFNDLSVSSVTVVNSSRRSLEFCSFLLNLPLNCSALISAPNICSASTAAAFGCTPNSLPIALRILLTKRCSLDGFLRSSFAPSSPIAVTSISLPRASPSSSGYSAFTVRAKSGSAFTTCCTYFLTSASGSMSTRM